MTNVHAVLDSDGQIWRSKLGRLAVFTSEWEAKSFRDKLEKPGDYTVGEIKISGPLTMPTQMYCDDCDGCGWVEGGETLKTDCKTCKGTGVLKLKKEKAT